MMAEKHGTVSLAPLVDSGIRRILLPRFDTHGDIILLKGFIDALLERLPSAEITLLVREGYDQLACLFSDRLAWRTQPWNPYAHFAEEELPSIRESMERFAAEPWDLVLFTTYDRTFLEDILAAMLEEPMCIALGRPAVQAHGRKRILARLNLSAGSPYDVIVPVDERLHETEKYRLLWHHLLGEDESIDSPRIAVPDPIRDAAEPIFSQLGLLNVPYVACMPAGVQNVSIKIWPSEFFAETLAWLAKERHLTPLLIGHESERSIVEELRRRTEALGVSVSLWLGRRGEMGLLAALLERAGLYLGNDSAPMHLAAALGTPTVGIFGGGTWPRFTAKGARCLSITAEVPCGYCLWDCPFGEALCLREIDPRDVKAGIDLLLQDTAARSNTHHVVASLSADSRKMMSHVGAKFRMMNAELHQRQEVIDELACACAALRSELQRRQEVIDELACAYKACRRGL